MIVALKCGRVSKSGFRMTLDEATLKTVSLVEGEMEIEMFSEGSGIDDGLGTQGKLVSARKRSFVELQAEERCRAFSSAGLS